MSQFGSHVEAGVLLQPFVWIYDAVAVSVGTEVPVSADADAVSQALQQLVYQQTQCGALFGRAGVGRLSGLVQSAFVGDAYGVPVVSQTVCSGLFQRSGTVYGAVAPHVVVVSDAVKSASDVFGMECLQCEGLVAPCCRQKVILYVLLPNYPIQ